MTNKEEKSDRNNNYKNNDGNNPKANNSDNSNNFENNNKVQNNAETTLNNGNNNLAIEHLEKKSLNLKDLNEDRILNSEISGDMKIKSFFFC